MLSPRCQEAYIKFLISDSQTSKLNTYVLLRNLVQKQTSTSEEDGGSSWAFKKAQAVKKYGINGGSDDASDNEESGEKDTKSGNEQFFSFLTSVISEFATEELRKPEEQALLTHAR